MQIDKRQQYLVIGAIAIVALFAGDKLIVSPLTGLWEKRAKLIKERTQDIADAKALQKRARWINEDWTKMRTNALPANNRAQTQAILQNAVDAWEKDSKIKIGGRRFQERTFEDEEYATLECNLDASGNIQAVTKFLYNLEKEPLPVRLEDLKVSGKDESGRELLVQLRISGLMIMQSKE